MVGRGVIEFSSRANSDQRVTAVLDVFKDKLVKRSLSLKLIDATEPALSGKLAKITVTITNGISQENAKKISKLIRDKGPKTVKAQIQGDELRVSSKSRDDLQEVQRSRPSEEDFDFAGPVRELPMIAGVQRIYL